MAFQTGFLAHNEKELVAWSSVLAMNNVVYFIHIEKLDGKKVYKIYAKDVTNKLKDLLQMQFDIQIETIQNIMV